MTQVARPIQDLSNNGWSPTPLSPRIRKLATDDSSYISSAGDPAGDTFEVALTPLDVPLPGPQELTVRWCQPQGQSVPVTVTLLQGRNIQIAQRVLPVQTSYFNKQVITLDPSEVSRISDYTELSVQISTAPPTITRRALGVISDYGQSTTLALRSVSVHSGEMLVVSVGSGDTQLPTVTFKGVPLNVAATKSNTGNCWAGIYYLLLGDDTTGDVVVTWPAAVDGRILAAAAISALTSASVDKTASSSGSGTSPSATLGNPTSAAKEYLHGLILFVETQATGNASWLNGFTSGQASYTSVNTSQYDFLTEGYKIVSASGTYTAAATLRQSGSWVALLATFM